MTNSFTKLLKRGRPAILGLLMVLLCSSAAWSQVSGTIVDENAEPLAGVTVVIKGTTTGTITDVDGNWNVTAGPEDVLLMSYVGYLNQEVTVGAQSIIDVQLILDVQQLEELVVTGYSVERKKDLLGAVAVADMTALKDVTNPDALGRLQGRVPGVFVQTSSDPGQGSRVTIRGNSTLGNNSPLYIIDGVPLQPFKSNEFASADSYWDLGWLNPADIESIQVLKDGASASIYGARASNGVVIITTKQAKSGKATVSVDVTMSVDTWNHQADLANSEQRATIEWQGAVNDGSDPDATGIWTYDWHLDPSLGSGIQGTGVPVLDQINYPEWLDENDQLRPAGHPQSVYGGTLQEGTDYFDEISQSSLVQNYNVSFAQGGERGGVNLSVNYFDQEGVVINTQYKRVSVRLNSNYNFANNKVTVGQNLAVTKGERQFFDAGFGGTPEQAPFRYKPVLPVFTEDGRFSGPPGGGFSDRDNPVALSEDNKDDRIHNAKVFGNIFLDWKIIEGLSFRTNLGVDYDNIFSRDIFRTYNRGFLANAIAELSHNQTHQTNWVWNNTFTYTKRIDKHSFTILAGTEAVENFVTFFSAVGKEFALETVDYFQLDAAAGERSSSGNSSGFSLFSYFGKANYSFADKYLAAVTIRRDGSSRFGSANQFAVFPAVSAGWRIGDEAFLSGSGVLSNLKIRAAWGKTGNQDILNDARFGLYRAVYAPQSVILPWDGGCAQTVCDDAATSYDIANNDTGILPSGFLATQTENQELKWESSTELNIGVDFGFLDDRLTGAVEYFNKTTEDILIQPVAIAAFGDGGSRWVNGADMKTNGFEFMLGYSSQSSGDWNYSVSFNGARYVEEITSLPEDLWSTYPGNAQQNIIGQAPRQLWGYRDNGIIQDQAQLDAAAPYAGINIGTLEYRDLDGDGVITALDQEYGSQANGRAGLEYGLNGTVSWKDFDLTLFFWGNAGRKASGDVGRMENSASINGENGGAATLNAWSPTNTGSHIPAARNSSGPAFYSLDYNVRNASFFTMRQLGLGYSLPQSAIGGVSWMSKLRVFLQAENLFWIIDKKGPDQWVTEPWHVELQPGTNGDVGGRLGQFQTRYPKPLRVSLGLNLGF